MFKPACIQKAQRRADSVSPSACFGSLAPAGWAPAVMTVPCPAHGCWDGREMAAPGWSRYGSNSRSSCSYCQGAVLLRDTLMCWRIWQGFYCWRGGGQKCARWSSLCAVFVHLSLLVKQDSHNHRVISSCFYWTSPVRAAGWDQTFKSWSTLELLSENKDEWLLYDSPDDCLAKMYRRPCSRHFCLLMLRMLLSVCVRVGFPPDWTAETNKLFSKQQKGSLMQTPETDTCLSTYIRPVLVFISPYCCNFGSFFMKLEAVEAGLESVVEHFLLLMS